MGRLARIFSTDGSGVILVLVLAIVGGVWAFAEIADEVRERSTENLDRRILLAMRHSDNLSRPVGPAWLPEMARDITALGGVAVLSLATLAVAGFLLLRRKYHAVVLVLVAALGGLVLSLMLKSAFARPRPDLVPHHSQVYTRSFPSGHSMMSATVYLTLGALLTQLVQDKRAKIYFLVVAMLLTFLVGASRVYVGVHWPTDVLAGWTAGLVWSLLCWLAARMLRRRGTVEEA